MNEVVLVEKVSDSSTEFVRLGAIVRINSDVYMLVRVGTGFFKEYATLVGLASGNLFSWMAKFTLINGSTAVSRHELVTFLENMAFFYGTFDIIENCRITINEL